ncbi:MAG: hypothetical protein GY694_00845 [Gammaproteobacteria bacterium]|nr:hypothetical protein [Gammaproteobacteria bacterium]
MTKNNDKPISWENATWDGSRIAQLKRSLKLTPKQRFEALDDFIEISKWFAQSKKIKKTSL